ncbi:autotransporter-associated beta strand repeat-containing protein [Prosthecobacter sp. SYSU 5D2]|uniref:beta strand repeat-containing protein n=1 Tax=Prosthecobacter sp. SYSU 5D2 TaxID=3134134 RepID=UPI0031FE6317
MKQPTHPAVHAFKGGLCLLLAGLSLPVLALDPDTPATGSFNVNANANWSTPGTWSGAIPNGVDQVADFVNNISTTRTITIDSGVGSNVTLGGLRIGDTAGGSVHQISGGTLTFQVTEGNAFYTRLNKGGSNTISSAIQLNSALDVLIADTNANSQGAAFSGKISGGVTGLPTINLRVNDADNFVRHLLLSNTASDFAGQIVVHSGLLRLEGGDGNGQAAGLRGVGNEVIILDGGRVDLRGTDYNRQADDTEIFIIEGKGLNGLGAIANTSSTGTLSHLVLSGDAMMGGGSTTELRRHLNAAGDADIAAILDLGGHELSTIGAGIKILENVDLRNADGATWNIYEGALQFRNRGGLLGGELIGGTQYGNDIDGMTFNVTYYKGTYDGVDPTNGSRSVTDLFNPNRDLSDTFGGTEVAARLIFRTDWATGNTHVANTKVVEMYDDVTINLNYGALVREGSTGAGQTFDQIFGTGTTINLVGGGMQENIMTASGGASGYNAALDAYDHPGVMEIQGSIDNMTGDDEGTGFTKRGNRELRLTGSNPNFDGDVLVKQSTARFMPTQFSTSSPTAAPESQFFSMSLAGAAGGLTGANSITLTRWGSLALLNNSSNGVYASVNNNDRLNDNGQLILRNGFIIMETDPVETNTENFGNVSVDNGTNYLFLDTRAGGQFDGSFASLSFDNGGILKIYDMNGDHTWGTGATDDRLRLNDTTGLTMIGADSPGSNTQGVIPGLFGGTVPTTFTASTGTQRTDYTTQNAYAYNGVGLGLMTLEGGYLRPLTASEYAVGGTPVAGANWMVDRYIGPGNTAGLDNYANRNVTEDTTVNSLTISFSEASSGQAAPTAAKDYVLIEPGKTLTVSSGIINFASFMENNAGSLESVIRGGRISMNGQAAILNAASNRHDLDTTSASLTTFLPGNSTYMRSSLVDVADLVKTGRHNLYLDTWNEVSGNVYVSEQGGLFARHPGALGEGAPGRELQVGGAGNFYLEYGTNISGINLRATNTFDTTRTILAALGTTHSTWGGDVIMDTADAAGSGEFQAHIITARNNGTLTIYGNVYSDNNANITGNDTWNDPVFISTATAETATINFRGQFRDTADGPLTSVAATGDGPVHLDRNHSLSFQMRGNDEINVNAFQQWDATGAIYATQGYFRILYDPAAEGLDGTGFMTDAARAAVAQDNQWNQMWLGGPQNQLGIANSPSNAYSGHIMLTREDQVLNYTDRIMISNNNRNRTLTLGGEHTSGTAYIGSTDPTSPYFVFFQNTNAERDLRFLQMRGGTLEVNARLQDNGSNADNFHSSVSMVGPGTVVFNTNTVSSNMDRWNFMAGTTVWSGAYANNQFARTRTTGSNVRASVSGWGGGDLVLATPEGTARRTQTLDGNIFMFNGSSSVTANVLTTMTIGDGARARVLDRRSGSTLAFYENGNGIINFGAAGVSMEAGDFLGSWGVYGNQADGINNWAGRQGTTGVQAFAGYDNDVFEATSHTNMTADAVLPGSTEIQTLRIGVEAELDIGAGNTLALSQGGLLIPSSNVGNVSITGGTLTSTWSEGSNDVVVHNYGQGVTTIGSEIANEGVNKVNLVLAGSGTTVLTGDNTLTGNVYVNDGVLQISSDSQLGQVDGSISMVVLVGPGTSYASGGTTGATVTFEGGGGSGAAATFNTVNSSTASLRGVNRINLTDSGSGYTSGVQIGLTDGTGSNAGAWAVLDSGNLHMDGGVLHATESLTLNSGRTIFLGGNGGTLRVDPGEKLTIDGFISGEYNHVNLDNGYASSNGMVNAWEAASLSNPDIGDLTIDGGGTVHFRYSPLGDGSSSANLAHAYGGITWINEGILRLEGVGTTGAAGALGSHRSFVDSTVIGANGTLDLDFSSSPVILEWLTLEGKGYQGGGTISLVQAGGTVSNSLGGQIHVKEDALLKMMNGHNIYINNGGGDMFGSGDITRMGNGDFRFYGNNPEWTGSFLSASGTSRVIGTGNLQGLSGMELERNSIFHVSTATTSVDEFRDRLPDDLAISSDGYTRLRMDATGGIHSGIEKVGSLTVKGGVMGIEYNLGADLIGSQPRLQGDYAGLHFTEIDRELGATVHLRNLDSGTDFAGSEFSNGEVTNRAVLMVDNAPAAIGTGDGSNGNAPVIPGFFGGTRALVVASSNGTTQRFEEAYSAFRMVTVDSDGAGVNYLRPLRDDEYKTVANPGGNDEVSTSVSLDAEGLTADQNLRIVGRDSDSISSGQLLAGRKNSLLTLGLSSTVNSLTFNSETYVLNGAANTTSSSTFGGDHTTLHLRDDTRLTVASGMIQTANFGTLDRQGITNNTNSNLDIRSQINAGTLDFAGQEAQIYVGGFFTRYNTAAQENGHEPIDADNTTLTIASNISNASALVKSGPGSLILTGVNDYTGDTYINQGNLYVRSDFALNGTENVHLNGAGAFFVSQGSKINGVDLHVGLISGNNVALALEQSAIWGGDIILNNVDLAGATSYTRSFIPRIYTNSTHQAAIEGNIYGGSGQLASGVNATESRIFTTYTGAAGILDLRGQVRDTVSGALGTLVTAANQNQVLRMEVSATTNEANVQLWQQYDASGQINLKRGYLRYMGEGNFYSDAAAASINPDNLMSGFHMGGRVLVSTTAGLTVSNLAFMLANDGSVFNLSSWTVGGDVSDPDNLFGSGNWGLGNTTGNSTLGGENRSGEVVFGTGTGTIKFTPYATGEDRDLRLYAAPGGEVTIRASFVDGGTAANPVNTSITKVGAGQVNLQGSTAGEGTVEGVNVMGGLLLLEDYDVNPDRRVGLNASLLMGGGILAMEGGQENFGTLTVAAGGSALAVIGTGQMEIATLGSVADGGSLHFQSIAGGTLQMGGFNEGDRLGSFATFGAALSADPTATDWAAVGAGGQVVAFTGYSDDTLGAGLHTNAVGPALVGGETESVRFNTDGAAFASGTLTLNDGGLLFTSAFTGGTAFASGTGLTTAGGSDLVLHNYSSGAVTIAGDISGSQNVIFTGTGLTELAGSNTYAGTTFVTGAATVVADGMGRLGTGSLHLNGGTVRLTGSDTEIYSSGITLGSSDGTLQVEAGKTLVLRGVVSSETNPSAALTTNPNSGGLRIEGSGTVQFGERTDGSTLVGVANNYTGLTLLGDGTNPLHISLQGGGNNNAQHTPFGTTDSWTDGTIVRNNVTLEFAPQYGSGAGTSQARYREWIQFGEQAGDQIYINHTTQRQIVMDGFYNVIGDLNIHAQVGSLNNGGTGNSTFYFNVNEGSLAGTGDIIKTGAGNLYFYNTMTQWTGDMDLREGLTLQLMYPGAALEDTGIIYMGDPAGEVSSLLSYRVQTRYGNAVTGVDSGRQRLDIPRDITIRDGINQEVQIGGSSSPDITMVYSGDINLGNGSTGGGGADSPNHVRFIYTDTTGYSGILTGHQQHAVMIVSGNLSGSNNLMLENVDDGSGNNDINDQFTTFLFSGDNSAYTGRLTIGSELGAASGNFDRDDNEIFRAGSDTALSASIPVEMRNMTTMQAGGFELTIGGLVTNDGISTTGLYSFTSPTFDPTRQTTADLDAVNANINAASGTLHGANSGGVNYIPIGNSSAIIENASTTPGTLRIVQESNAIWDAYFRDGVPAAQFEDSSATPGSLSLEKLGAGSATLTIYNDYTGTTTVSAGQLQVGRDGTGEWGIVNQGSTALFGAMKQTANTVAGSTGTGLTTVMAGANLSGTGHVRGGLELHGTLAPGDFIGELAGATMGTLFVGDGGVGDLTLHAGATVSLQIALPSMIDPDLQAGTYRIGDDFYTTHVAFLDFFSTGDNLSRAFPFGFGQGGSHIPTTNHDHLEISGSVIWDGGQISVLGDTETGFIPEAGQVFNLLDWYNMDGTDWGDFSTGSGRYLVGNGDDNGHLDLPDLSAYPELRWDTGIFFSHGALVISIVPEPSRAVLTLLGLGMLLFRRRR